MTTALEVQITESTSSSEELECNLCKRSTPKDDVFPLGTQDPLNQIVAVILACRGCFVSNISLDLRRAIYALWDV